MARPIKKSIDFFSFDTDFFEDDKIKKLRIRYRANGLIIYLHLICHTYKENGYFLFIDEDIILELADLFNISIEEIKEIINYCESISLFKKIELLKNNYVLTSERIQKNYMLAVKTRAKKIPVVVDPRAWILSREETEDYIVIK